jgi:ribonuclease Z
MVDLCLLGCGGMMPLPNRWLTALLYRYDGKILLIDCGEGTQVPLKIAGFGFKAIEAICFTHYHADHTAGLPGLLLTIGNSGRREPLTLIGPPGLERIVVGLTVIAPQLPYELRLIECSGVNPDSVSIGGIHIGTIPVEHRLPCLSYSLQIKRAGRFDLQRAREENIPMEYWKRLQNGEAVAFNGEMIEPATVMGPERRGIKMSYCTDLRPNGQLAGFVAGSDLLICEGLHGDDAMQQKTAEKKHMIFSEAAALAQEGRCRELWLTHYSPAMEQPEEYLDNARAIFTNTLCGHDLMSKTLNFED